jgi:uncharacterized protein
MFIEKISAMTKNNLTALIIGVSVLLSSLFLGYSFVNRNKKENTISVTGLGKKDFTSDLIVWTGYFSKKNYNLKSAYAELDKDREALKTYLINKGIDEKAIVFSSVLINKDFESYFDPQTQRTTNTFTGYTLTQNLNIESREVDKIEGVSRKISEVISSGVEFYSNAPEYYYTKLAELKQSMIAQGTQDAKERAEKIAENAGTSLGGLKKAVMGVFQITGQNSSEEYSWGGSFNTLSKNKTATITIKLDYEID